MANSPAPVESGPWNWKGVLAGLLFALAVLGGALATVAVSYEGEGEGDSYHSDDGDGHGDDKAEKDDDHSDG